MNRARNRESAQYTANFTLEIVFLIIKFVKNYKTLFLLNIFFYNFQMQLHGTFVNFFINVYNKM